MTSKKLLSFSVVLFVAAALAYCASIALGGDERTGHFDAIEYLNGVYKTTVRAGTLSGNTTFTLPATTGSSTQLLHGGATQTFAAASLTTDVTGTLPVANGGTGQTSTTGAFNAISPMTTLGDTIYGAASGAGTRLGGNTSATKNFLTQTGDGAASAAPAWGTIAVGDVPSLPASKITSGTLAVAQGGTNLASGTSGGVLAYTASGTLASSGALTANAVVVGGGAGVVPSVVTNNGTATNEFLTQSSSGAPAWAALLAADIPNLSASKITSGQIAIANGGTGAATATTGFDALSPLTTAGDVIYGGASGTGTRLAAGSATTVLHSGTTPSWSAVSLTTDVTGTLPAGNGGTGLTSLGTGVATWLGTPSSANLATAVTDETGSGALVFGTAPTITLANGSGLPISTGVSGLGSGVATFLATPSSANLITAVTDETGSGALVFGTAPTITLANGSGLPISTGVSGLGTGVATFLATPSSANLASAVTDETGTGAVVFGTSPQFTTNLDLLAAGESRYYNAGGTFYVGFKGGNAAANKIWTLPLADGSSNQALVTNGSGVLSWATASTNPTTTTGDIIYSSTTTTPGTLARLGIGGATTVLHGGTTPSYSAVALATDVSGTLPTGNAGTGLTTYATGDTIYASATNVLSKLAAGTIGQVNKQGATIPAWSWPDTLTATSSSYNAASFATDGTTILTVTTGASTITVTLPTAASPNVNRPITIKKVDAGSGKITIATTSSQTIDGYTTTDFASTAINQWAWIKVVSDGTSWNVVGTGGEHYTDTFGTGYTTSQTGTTMTSRSLPAGTWKVLVNAFVIGAPSGGNATCTGYDYQLFVNGATNGNVGEDETLQTVGVTNVSAVTYLPAGNMVRSFSLTSAVTVATKGTMVRSGAGTSQCYLSAWVDYQRVN